VVQQFDRAKSVQSTNNVDTDIKYGNPSFGPFIDSLSLNFEVFSAESLWARLKVKKYSKSGLSAQQT
jgi:hypothetical protein